MCKTWFSFFIEVSRVGLLKCLIVVLFFKCLVVHTVDCLNVQFLKSSTVEIFAVCASPAVRGAEREEEDVAAKDVVLNLQWVGGCLSEDKKDKRRLDRIMRSRRP